MLNFFKSIAHWFVSLFGASSSAVQDVLQEVSNYINFLQPIIAELAQIGQMPATEIPAALEKFLLGFEADVAKVSTFISTLTGKDIGTVLHDSAVFVLTFFAPGGTALHLLNLAVELAYAVYVKTHPATLPAPAAILPAK